MSVQVQLRRDTLANVLANHGALGEVYISTDSKELFIQDGATNGGFKASGVRALFGSLAQPALAESTGASGENAHDRRDDLHHDLAVARRIQIHHGRRVACQNDDNRHHDSRFWRYRVGDSFCGGPIAEPDGGQHRHLRPESSAVRRRPSFSSSDFSRRNKFHRWRDQICRSLHSSEPANVVKGAGRLYFS